MQGEVAKCLRMLDEVYSVFGLQYTAALSTRPEKRMGSEEQWDSAEGALRHALEAVGKTFEVCGLRGVMGGEGNEHCYVVGPAPCRGVELSEGDLICS